jgi:PAS domain S-box-containing protein
MRTIITGAVVMLVTIGVFLLRPTTLSDLDAKVCDVLTGWAGPGEPSRQVVIVEIDEKSLTRFGRWPWPRDLMGQLTRGIFERGAATAVLDMMFPQADGGNDEVLADALSNEPAVVGYTMKFDGGETSPVTCQVPTLPLVRSGPGDLTRSAVFHARGAVCSVPVISRAALGNGFLNAAPDHDGTLRRVPMVIESGANYYPSMALATLMVYRHVSKMQLAGDTAGARRLRLDDRSIALEGPSLLRLRFRGRRRTLPYVSAADVLSATVPDDALRGKIVIVGGSAPGLLNPVVTPLDALFPSVEVQATAVDNLLQGDSFWRPADAQFWELLAALVVGAASIVLLVRTAPFWGLLAVLVLGAGAWAGCAWAVASSRMVVSPLAVTAILGCNLPVITLLNYLQEKNRADRAQQELVVTTQRSVEVLRESEFRYQRLVENVNDAIIVDDVSGRLVFANRRFREWFGLPEGEIGNVSLDQYVAPEWRSEVRDHHDRRMRGEAVPDQFEFEGVRANGSRIWIEARVTKVEENGRIVGTQSALRDATERKRIEAQYLQSRKMESVGRLAGGVAHDFNNLLTVINAYSDLLLSQLKPGDPSQQGLEEIRKAGDRAAELTKKLLTFSRKQLVRPRAVNLNALVTESERMLERVIGEDIELVTRLNPELGQATCDPGQMHQVLMNLVVNARDAMPQGGKIVVETRNIPDAEGTGACVYLSVTDYGVGMSDDVKQHLYEPFFTTKDTGKGTGLGLATVYGIIQQIGGRIEVESELGRGTTFHIYLPRTDLAATEPPTTPVPAAELRGSETVLVVEDQEAVRHLAITILKNYGYRVLQATNGPEAIALANGYKGTIHLLLTDIIMPSMDGRVLAKHMKTARPEIKVLYVSGYSEDKIGHGQLLDADLDYIAKPFTPTALAARIRQILGSERGSRGEASAG